MARIDWGARKSPMHSSDVKAPASRTTRTARRTRLAVPPSTPPQATKIHVNSNETSNSVAALLPWPSRAPATASTVIHADHESTAATANRTTGTRSASVFVTGSVTGSEMSTTPSAATYWTGSCASNAVIAVGLSVP